jgi:mannose-6-phosphate isomerase
MKLAARLIEKPWGRTQLPPSFPPAPGLRIGEIWFAADGVPQLLAKYLFTSEKLSVQVHPDDEQARQRGVARGKAECWYVLDAEPGATIGLGLSRPLDREGLRSAALDGSIVEAMDWRPVRAGDFFYVPPGTIHAIGGGISLLEFQQNSDVTYRLYDYGRPRELHLDDGVAVAAAEPYPDSFAQHLSPGDLRTLVEGPQFVLVHTDKDALQDGQRWVMPLEGEVRHNGESARAGDCLLVGPGEAVECDGRMLIGATA